jgi:hypothetical protein
VERPDATRDAVDVTRFINGIKGLNRALTPFNKKNFSQLHPTFTHWILISD